MQGINLPRFDVTPMNAVRLISRNHNHCITPMNASVLLLSHVPLSLPTEIQRLQNPHSHSHNAPDLMSHIGGRGYRTSEKIYIPNEEQRRVWPSLLTIIIVKFLSFLVTCQCVLCWVGSYWSMSGDLMCC